MKKAIHSFRPYLYIVVSAVLSALSFAPFLIWPLAFVAFWPIFYLLETENFNLRKILFFWLTWALATNFLGYHWLIYTIAVFGHLPYPVAFLIFLLYSVGSSLRFLFFLSFHYAYRHFFKSRGAKNPSLLWYTFFWGLSELFGYQLFPWYGANLMGGNLLFMQWLDVFGIKALSLLWFFLSLLLYQTLLSALRGKKHTKIRVALSLSLLLVIHLYGFWRYQKEVKEIEKAPRLRVGVIQGNTPLSFAHLKNIREAIYQTISNMVDETIALVAEEREKGKNLDLIVWPESATPFVSYQKSLFFQQEMQRLNQNAPIPIILNDILYGEPPLQEKAYSNMFLLLPTGQIKESYQKVFLLPFGEYMPLGDVFPFLKEAFPEVSDFSSGSRYVLFPIEKANILPAICYEIISSGFIQSFYQKTQKKANLIVNITNDTWFGKSIETYQHLELGRWRAVELRIPIVRAVNSGVSALIDSAGRIYGKTQLFTKQKVVYEVPIVKSSPTIYSYLGDRFLYGLLFFLGLVIFMREKQNLLRRKV